MSLSKRLLCLLLIAAVPLALAGCHRRYAYTSIPSGAMKPTIAPGSVVTVNFNAYKHHKPIHRWDIIAFKSKRTIVVKRVIGLPGETIRLAPDGKILFVNGKPLPVPASVPWRGHHLTYRTTANYPIVGHTVHVPAHHLYVLGDNLRISDDSREVGPIKRSKVTGKVMLKTKR